MAKKYSNNWNAKKLIISFNQKQWRQDFAAFVRDKLFWSGTRVTRSRAMDNNPLNKGLKSFEVYNGYGGSVQVVYKNNNDVVSSTNQDLVNQYFEERSF